jgi:hypothetical protein
MKMYGKAEWLCEFRQAMAVRNPGLDVAWPPVLVMAGHERTKITRFSIPEVD